MTGTASEFYVGRPQTVSNADRPATSIGNGTKTRKIHKKSRHGCQTCKRRKIKCDESRPECAKCKNFGVPCDFLPPEDREIGGLAALPVSQPTGERRKPGRPRGDWTRQIISHAGGTCRPPRTFSPSSQPPDSTPAFTARGPLSTSFDVGEVVLFHHYLTVTATIGQPHIWRDGVPQLGETYPGILHAMLSISAYHLARTDLLRAPKHLNAAEKHYAVATTAATAMVADVTIENAQAVYVITALICFIAFAKGPRPGDLVLVAKDRNVAWVYLLRGVRMVIAKFGASVVFSGLLDPNAREYARPSGCSYPSTDLQPRERRFELRHPGWDWHGSLERLSSTVAASGDPDQVARFQRQITSIIGCFRALEQPREVSDENSVVDFITVITWVWTLDDSFIDALKEGHQVALVILGCFGVLLKSLRGYWWLDGWGDHILKEVGGLLGSTYQEWLP